MSVISFHALTSTTPMRVNQPRLDQALLKLGVIHEKWDLANVSLDGVDLSNLPDGFLSQLLCKNQERIQRIENFRTAEGSMSVIKLSRDTQGIDALLEKFKVVHYHAAPEIRLIIDGEGIFYIYENGNKHEILVKKGSFLVLPKEIDHNFTLTEKLNVTALRVFQDKDGWLAKTR